MRKILSLLLCFILAVSALFGGTSVALAADEETVDTTFNYENYVESENYSYIRYYEFSNPIKVAAKNGFIVVLEGKTSGSEGRLLAFLADGTLLYSEPVPDPRDVAIVGNTAVVLDYDLENDATHLYGMNLSTGAFALLPLDKIVFDLSANSDSLFILCGGLSRKIEKYYVTGGNDMELVRDETFVSNSAFSLATQIYANDTSLSAFYTSGGFNTITSVTFSGEKRTDITSLPSGGVIDFACENDKLFVLSSTGVFVGNLQTTPNFSAALTVAQKNTSDKLVSPSSISVDNTSGTVKIFVSDNTGALSIKRFIMSGNALVSDYFSIGSFSADDGAFDTPTDITSNYDRIYICDSLNSRIVVKTATKVIGSFDVKDENGKSLTPRYVGADANSNIYVATSTSILKFSSTYKLLETHTRADSRNISNITALYVSTADDTVYAVDSSRLLKYDPASTSFVVAKSSGSSATALAVDMRLSLIYLSNGGSVTAYNMSDYSRVGAFSVSLASSSINDIEVDFFGNVYALCSTSYTSFIYKYALTDGKYVFLGRTALDNDNGVTFKKLAFDNEKKAIYLLPTSEHRLYKAESSTYRELKISYYYDISVPTDIFDQTYDKVISIAKVKSGSNGLIYPLNVKDDLYPVNYATVRATKLSAGSQIIVCGYTEDGLFAYILNGNLAGFMDVSSLEISDQGKEVPFKNGVALHDNLYIYKYPLLTTEALLPVFSCGSIEKQQTLSLLNMADDYVCPSGLMWYFVSYTDEDGATKYGYIPRYNVVENYNETYPSYEQGRVNADILKGSVDVYADEGLTKLGVSIVDGTKIYIISQGAQYSYIQEIGADGSGITGYIPTANITLDAQTRSQTIAIVLISAAVLVVGVMLLVKLAIKNKKKF